MKILHIIDSNGLYGAEIVLLNLMEVQVRFGLSPMLLCVGNTEAGEKEVEREARRRNLKVLSLRFHNGFNIMGIKKILKIVKKLQIDIIHSHGYKSDILLGILPLSIRKIPILSTLHGWTAIKIFTKIWLYEVVHVFVLKNVDKVTVVSEAIKNKKLLKILKIKTTVIENGLTRLDFNTSGFKKRFPLIEEACKNKFSIIAIGRLSAEKGYDILLRAIKVLYHQKLEICLVVVGIGREEKKLINLVNEYNLSEQVHFVGYVKEAYKILPLFDLFVLPSLTEGLPITVLEAMQAGIPIIASSVGSIPKLLSDGKYGRLVNPGDVNELAEAIRGVYLDLPKSKAIAQMAKSYVLKRYTMEKTTSDYIEQYEQLLLGKEKL